MRTEGKGRVEVGFARGMLAPLLLCMLALAIAWLPPVAVAEQQTGDASLVVMGDDSEEGDPVAVVGDGGGGIETVGLSGTSDAVIGVDAEPGDSDVVVEGGDEGNAVVPQFEDEPPLEAQASAAHVSYRTHVQSYGWQGNVRDGEVSGTSGRAKRLEGIEVRLVGAPYSGGVTYRTHVQGIGWQAWRSNGQMAGTSGQAKRLEAIEIKLTGTMASKYDVWYRVHAQSYGWMGWAKNGASAGTAGYAYRLEGIEIRLTAKNAAAPGTTAGAFRSR